MALPKVCGIETEYGIVVRGAENNPVSASSLLINAYVVGDVAQGRVGLRRRAPGQRRARVLARRRARPRGRDDARQRGAHQRRSLLRRPRPSRDLDARGVQRARGGALGPRRGGDRAGVDGVRAPARSLPGGELVVYKNNSDGKGNSYGCHENYLLARELPFGRIVAQITPHFVTRQIFCGAGKVGCELPGRAPDDVAYQLSQRADFFEEEVGLETTLKRPIVNTRDEPHCDPQKYRRLHVIVGDANMSEVATYLKVGTTAIVLAMIEDDELGDDWLLGNPVGAIRQVSHDPSLTRTVMLRDGRRATAIEVQWGLLERARKYERLHGLAAVGEEVGADVLDRWERVLTGLEHDPDSVAHWVDWVAKRRLVEGYAERHGLEPASAKLKAIDLQYHDLRAERSLARRAGLETLVTAGRGARRR